jgi:Arc/MetJ family transcription regulator
MTVMHMRTTLDLPEGLVAEAREASNLPTGRATLIAALDEFARSRLRARLVARLGRTRLSITQDDVEAMREDDDDPAPGEPTRLILPPEGEYPWVR